MSRIRLIILSLMAIFAMSAVTASAALAADAGQEFTAVPTKAKLTSTSGLGTLKAGTDKVVCQKDTDSGTAATKTTVTGVVVVFTSCESEEEVSKCKEAVSSVGAKNAGEVVTNKLKGELGEDEALEATAKGTVLLLKGEAANEFVTLAKNKCTPETKVTGSVAGVLPAAELNKKVKEGKLEFNVVAGKQQVAAFENSADVKTTPGLKAFGKAATEETTDTNVFEEEVEIKSGE